MRRFQAWPILLPAALCLLGAFCRTQPPPRNFILVTLDTQRADYLNCYRPGSAATPRLDGLARRGLRFETCLSLIPITLPSHASVFFSEQPFQVKNYNNGQVIRPLKSRPTLATLFRKNGFTTAAFVSLGVLKSVFGLAEGFDLYREEFPSDRWYLHAEEVNRQVLPWLEKNSGRPFFLWVHYSDPHEPYITPDAPPDMKVTFNGRLLGDRYYLSKYLTIPLEVTLGHGRNEFVIEVSSPYYPNNFQARLDLLEFDPPFDSAGLGIEFVSGWFIRRPDNVYFLKNRAVLDVINRGRPRPFRMTLRGKMLLPPEVLPEYYKKEVEYMDFHFGRLLDKLEELGRLKDTAILVFGDHGEGLGEYLSPNGDRHVGHIHYLYEKYMRVPLILYRPGGREAGQVRTDPVTLLDMAPTITQVMGLKRPSFYQGRSLLDRPLKNAPAIFEQTYKPEAAWDKFALRRYPWHLIFTPEEKRYEVFDLASDPAERTNIFPQKAGQAEILALRQELEKMTRDVLQNKEVIPLDKSAEELLKSLGYIRK